MPSAKAIISKISSLLSKVRACDREVYKRTYTKIGGDELIGSAEYVSADTKLVPTPAVRSAEFDRSVVLWSGGRVQTGDLLMVVSPSSVTSQELADKSIRFVFKDGSGGETEYNIVAFAASMYDTDVVCFRVLLRKVGVR